MAQRKDRGGHSPQGALFALLAASVAAAAWAAADAKYQVVKDTSRYTRIAPAALEMIEQGETAFLKRDASALAPTLSEDYSYWLVTEQGPTKAMQGREGTIRMVSGFFANAQWFDSKVYRLGMVGNMLVQVEVDTVGSPQGPVTKTSLEIYEFRDGKRWREWRFSPTDSPM
jgi:limonene-1,2-epoxide hydrolase